MADNLSTSERTPPPDHAIRMAKCGCGQRRPSSSALAFFENCAEGSRQATTSCKHCGYYDTAHTVEGMAANVASNQQTVVERGYCKGFEPHGAYEFDRFYCGCRGFD